MDGMIPGMQGMQGMQGMHGMPPGMPPGMHPIPGMMEEQLFDPEAYHHHLQQQHQHHQQQQHQQQHHFQEFEEPSRRPEFETEEEGAPGDSQIRFPVALEKALDLKSERAKQIGADEDQLDDVHEKLKTDDERRPLGMYSDGEDEDDDEEIEDEEASKKVESKTLGKKEDKKRKRKKRKKKKRHGQQQQNKENVINGDDKFEEKDKEKDKEKEKDPEVEVEYVQETVNMNQLHPQYRQYAKILEHFKIPESEMKTQPIVDISREMRLAQELGAKSKELTEFKKVPKLPDEFDDDEGKQDGDKKEKLSKRKLKKLTRLSVAELKQLVSRPDVVEMHDVTARDPKLLVQLKAHRNTVPVPRHWCFKRKYLQGKRGIEKPPFELPHFIKKTGIMEMRSALTEKDEQKALKAKMREKARPKLGKIDIDYQKLHDAFFKWQTKPKLTIHGDLYYEGKEYETRLREKKPGDLSDELRTALGMPVGPHAHKVPPPWLIAMQRYGPPPSYPSLKIPGLNAPIPEGCSFGYHAGGWGKPPVDETGKPLYGDVFGIQTSTQKIPEIEYEVDKSIWGELESESEEESEEEEEEEGEGAEEQDETGMATPAEGLVTPSGIASITAGIHTPDIIELRKRKIESEMEGGETPALYQVLPEKKVEKVSGMMGSTHIYDVPSVPGGPIGTKRPDGPGTVELALDPSELDLVDTEAMAARYEEQIKEQQSQLIKEDLSDVVAEHISRQKAKRKKPPTQEKSTKKYKEFKF